MTVEISCVTCRRTWSDGDLEDQLHLAAGLFRCPHERSLWPYGIAVAAIYLAVLVLVLLASTSKS